MDIRDLIGEATTYDKLSRTGVSNVLSALKSAGVIRHNGPKNGGSWEIVKPQV